MTKKVPLQEKIAELESRIAKLERDASEHWGRDYSVRTLSPEADKEWTALWQHFKNFFEIMFR
jgi:hypothetical protein